MKTINRLASFIKADHRYVYLGTSVIAALGLAFSQRNPTPMSFLAPTGVFQNCLWAILWAWLVVSAAALVTKLMHWNDYREKSPFASERCRRGARLGSYVVVAIAAIFFVDRCVMSFIDLVQVSIVSDSNPSDFLSSLVYMTYKSGDFFIRGIEITIALATFGTVIAFFLALLFVSTQFPSVPPAMPSLPEILLISSSCLPLLVCVSARMVRSNSMLIWRRMLVNSTSPA